MGLLSVITFTTGVAGCGKSFRRCAHFLVNEFLKEPGGVHYSNFPVFRDVLASEMHKRTGRPEQEFLDRVQVIPQDEIKRWEKSNGVWGPWTYFEDIDLCHAHIAIDEIHNYCGTNTPRKVRQKWQEWLGEIRHRGCTVEFISQAPQKVAKEIHHEAGVRLSLTSQDTERDPFLKYRCQIGMN